MPYGDPGCQGAGHHAAGALGIAERADGVSVEMAIRLSKAFGSTPETWLGLQMAHDLWQARDRAAEITVERSRRREGSLVRRARVRLEQQPSGPTSYSTSQMEQRAV